MSYEFTSPRAPRPNWSRRNTRQSAEGLRFSELAAGVSPFGILAAYNAGAPRQSQNCTGAIPVVEGAR
jgi:hypothetical protein